MEEIARIPGQHLETYFSTSETVQAQTDSSKKLI